MEGARLAAEAAAERQLASAGSDAAAALAALAASTLAPAPAGPAAEGTLEPQLPSTAALPRVRERFQVDSAVLAQLVSPARAAETAIVDSLVVCRNDSVKAPVQCCAVFVGQAPPSFFSDSGGGSGSGVDRAAAPHPLWRQHEGVLQRIAAQPFDPMAAALSSAVSVDDVLAAVAEGALPPVAARCRDHHCCECLEFEPLAPERLRARQAAGFPLAPVAWFRFATEAERAQARAEMEAWLLCGGGFSLEAFRSLRESNAYEELMALAQQGELEDDDDEEEAEEQQQEEEEEQQAPPGADEEEEQQQQDEVAPDLGLRLLPPLELGEVEHYEEPSRHTEVLEIRLQHRRAGNVLLLKLINQVCCLVCMRVLLAFCFEAGCLVELDEMERFAKF